jgi:glycosyltransferase involved in cell wall biosynthesis
MVTPFFFPHMGGVESHVYEVAGRLTRQNAEISVLTTDPSGKLPHKEWMAGFQVLRVRAWPKNSDFCFAPGIYRIIRDGQWDLIHIQSYHTLVPPLAMSAALRSCIPYVVTFHGGGHSSRLRNRIRTFQRTLLGPFLRRAARLVAVAGFEVIQYGQELSIPPDRFTLIPNGCDLPGKPRADKQISLAEGEGIVNPIHPLIVSVGRLERYKGHQRLIAAMPLILKEIPGARLWIAGAGPEETRLRQQVTQLSLQGQVEIRAIPSADRQAMAEELSRASLSVLLSEFETHPIAVLEAVSLGVPALVTDTSGLRELAEKGLARSIPLNSRREEIARAVVEMLHHPHKPPSVELSTWSDCAQGLFRLYGEILGLLNGERYAYPIANPGLSAHLRRD